MSSSFHSPSAQHFSLIKPWKGSWEEINDRRVEGAVGFLRIMMRKRFQGEDKWREGGGEGVWGVVVEWFGLGFISWRRLDHAGPTIETVHWFQADTFISSFHSTYSTILDSLRPLTTKPSRTKADPWMTPPVEAEEWHVSHWDRGRSLNWFVCMWSI